MNRLLDEGFAQERGKITLGDRVWYLSHLGVQNSNKSGRVRLVFDAAAKINNTSFNNLLLSGPDLLKSLPGVIMRFRQFAYAIKADIVMTSMIFGAKSSPCTAKKLATR